MPLPDTITTTAAAFYGLAVAHAAAPKQAPKQAKEKTEEPAPPAAQDPIAPMPVDPAAVLPSNWSDASDAVQEAFKAPARFLQSYLRGSACKTVDRNEVAMTLASTCKDTLVAGFCGKGAYRQMVDIFCCIQQSLL